MAAKMTANLGVDFDRIVEVLEKVTAVTGRLQRITALESEVQVFVDYAHTPDALEKSLLELRNIKANFLRIFGSWVIICNYNIIS